MSGMHSDVHIITSLHICFLSSHSLVRHQLVIVIVLYLGDGAGGLAASLWYESEDSISMDSGNAPKKTACKVARGWSMANIHICTYHRNQRDFVV